MDNNEIVQAMRDLYWIEEYLEADKSQFKDVYIDRIKAVIKLLKEMTPVAAEIEGSGDAGGSWWYVCGDCHTSIDRRDKYCRECGRKVLWG